MTITYKRPAGQSLIREIVADRTYIKQVEVDYYPIIGEKYQTVFCGDYDNTEYGANATIEVTADNIDAITFAMNDPDNDITEYILIEQ